MKEDAQRRHGRRGATCRRLGAWRLTRAVGACLLFYLALIPAFSLFPPLVPVLAFILAFILVPSLGGPCDLPCRHRAAHWTSERLG